MYKKEPITVFTKIVSIIFNYLKINTPNGFFFIN